MTSVRREEKPSFSEVDDPKELEKIGREILKIRPGCEVSIEGFTELARGRIVDWHDSRKLFTVKWEKKSEKFDEVTNAKTGLRAFFKSQLFTTQLVFKTTTVRKLEDGAFHYRIPAQIFSQQRRGALRVPIDSGDAIFYSDQGRFKIIDLSVGGAKLAILKPISNTELNACALNLAGVKLSTEDFRATVTFRGKDQIGIRFAGLNEAIKTQIKHYLIEALKLHYEKEW